MCFFPIYRERVLEEAKHCQWFQNFFSDKDISDIDNYRKNDVFASRIGDVIVDVCRNILCIPIVVISSIDNMTLTLRILSNPLYLVYNADEPVHYDGTKELTRKGIRHERMKKKRVFYLMKMIISTYCSFEL